MRPSFHAIYMQMAEAISQRSTCQRTDATGHLMQVGCVIVTPDFRKMVSCGYNGNAAGLPNQCDSNEPGLCLCLHGEENAVINCDVPRATEKIVFCTHLPCRMCAKRLINLGGVREVYYRRDYRLKDSLMLFAHPNVDIVVGHLFDHDVAPSEAQKVAANALAEWRKDLHNPGGFRHEDQKVIDALKVGA